MDAGAVSEIGLECQSSKQMSFEARRELGDGRSYIHEFNGTERRKEKMRLKKLKGFDYDQEEDKKYSSSLLQRVLLWRISGCTVIIEQIEA